MLAHRQLIRFAALFTVALCAASATAEDVEAVRGMKLFRGLGCQTCHTIRGVGGPSGGGATETKAPDLAVSPEGGPFYGSMVELSDHSKVEVNDEYLLEAITNPAAVVVMDVETGRPYPGDKMPDRFKHLPPGDLAAMVAYIKALSGFATSGEGALTGLEMSGVVETTDHGPANSPVWVWFLVGFCGAVVAGAGVFNMSRNISWRWIGIILLIPTIAAGVGIAVAHHSGGAAEREIHITARQFAYDPPIINVNRGDRVTITLKSQDVLHGFYLDGYDIDEEVRPGEDTRFSFVANKPGRFSYRCSHTCGVFHPFMIGNLIVSPNYLFPSSIGLCFGLGLATFIYVANKKEQ